MVLFKEFIAKIDSTEQKLRPLHWLDHLILDTNTTNK